MLKQVTIEYGPSEFYQLVEVINGSGSKLMELAQEWLQKLAVEHQVFKGEIEKLEEQYQALLKESTRTTRRNPFKMTDEPDFLGSVKGEFTGQSFIRVIFDIVTSILHGYDALRSVGDGIRFREIKTIGDLKKADSIKSTKDFETFSMDVQLHGVAIAHFVQAVMNLEVLPKQIVGLGRGISDYLENYNSYLRHRHSLEGIKVHRDPIITDIAISIFKNVDSDGEIEDGRSAKEISIHSVKKANILTESIKNGWLGDFIEKPETLMDFIRIRLEELWTIATTLSAASFDVAKAVRAITGHTTKPNVMSGAAFRNALESIKDLNPINVTFKEKTGLLSAEERKALEFQNETLSNVVYMLTNETTSSRAIVEYILTRKEELRKYNIEENSFYVCKIDSGNAFLGESPGALKVIPGIRPVANLEDVVGSGFDEAREFIEQIDSSNQWADLFIATSPSKKTDKTNVLLIGPQGCGKTEVLRGVTNRKGIISVFAQASDFLTCWKGEMEKNPKRLFEAGLELHKESDRNVYFLIDEIDTILNSNTSQYSFGGTNLSSEFQVLMDGIASYAGLAVWGATNHPDRLPTPILRRFAKVLIVGELNQADRIKLLKRFCGYMPISTEVTDQVWEDVATRLEGAVGDVIRKVVDHLWRVKMNWFVQNNQQEGKKIIEELNKINKFDVSKFSHADRQSLINRLRPYVSIQPADLISSVDAHLNNVAIKREIEVCKATYDGAREFIAAL